MFTPFYTRLVIVALLTIAMLAIGQAAPPTYKVRAGDTVWGIAQKHKVKANDLKEHNNLRSNLLRIGQVLKVPQQEVRSSSSTRHKTTAKSPSTRSQGRTVIILDPGHGGRDPGAIYGGTREKDLNLRIAKRCRDLLSAHGFLVKMTRYDDRYLSLNQRTKLCNTYAKAIVVSIHFNAYGKSRSINGIETFYASSAGRKLAGQVHRNVLRSVNQRDRGLKFNSNYDVLMNTRHPAALVELGFMSNPAELRKIRCSITDEKRAQGIVRGLRSYFGYL
ncbi:MAG: N-acetylmuramoyl-L-alanine amidase [Akkermansiaceae bacterium]